MKLFFRLVVLFSGILNIANAQYYYNDIVATQQSNAQQQLLLTNKIRIVKAQSKENDNSVTDGFTVEQKINKDASEIVTTTKSSAGVSAVLTSYYVAGKISKTKNESNDILTVTDYLYDQNGLLQTITSATTDTAMNSFSSETHHWFFNANGKPVKMLKIKNNTDTTFVDFVLDDKQMVAVENWRRKGKTTESYFYYYNDKNQLTDIVRYNERLKKMLPDFVYEYDAAGRIKQMIQVLAGGSNYNTWKYTYNENGLKQKESCYDKQKQLIGVIEYIYNN